MTLLQILFILSGIVIFILAFDIARKEKFNAIHFLIFIFVGIGLLLFSFFPSILNRIGLIFGLQRGADLLVYVSILFLFYFALLLLRKTEDNRDDLTKFVRELAIDNSKKEEINGKVLFLIRVYNEAKVLKNTLDVLLKTGYKNILVVNDGSTDNSKTILETYGNKIILLNHLRNRGGGAALETGFEYIRRFGKTDYICTFDADGQHRIEDLGKFIKILDNNRKIDVVLGSRFISKTNTNISFVRKVVLKLGIVFTFFVSNIKLTDSHNGYRVFRTKIIDEIKLTIDDMTYASEMMDIISTKGIKFMEVPVDILYTDYSRGKGQKSSNAINIAIKFIWNKFFR
ncbi:MAG: DUF2304 family protein [Candidatus Gracilibacteria bacterium]|nr:DUF2304 family protein [Candidatus Gracilibacteria bacterium]